MFGYTNHETGPVLGLCVACLIKIVLILIIPIFLSELGTGFAWEPTRLKVKVGDTVHWKWTTPDLVEGVKYKVEQTDTALSNDTGSYGFCSESEGTRNGKFEEMVS